MSTIILVVLILELTLFFLFSGCIKIFGWPKKKYDAQLTLFSKFGLNQNLVTVVGAIELFGAVTLWLPNYIGVIGVWLLCAVSAMVIYGHVRFGKWKEGLLSIAIFVISSWIFYTKCLVIWA